MLASILERPVFPAFLPETEYPCRVLRCEVGRELEARQHLAYRDINCYLPTYESKRRTFGQRGRPSAGSSGAIQIITKALYAGYVFCSFNDIHRNLVITSPHVFDLLRFGHEDAVISTEEMQRIQALSSLAAEPWTQIPDGARIRICSGPLTNTEGTLIRHKGVDSVVIEISMLQRLVRVEVNGYEIEKA